MKLRHTLLGLLAMAGTASTQAEVLDIEVVNLTHGIYFTPILVAAHDGDVALFEPGASASAELAAMAEGGDISGLSANVMAAGGAVVENPAEGLLGPAATVMIEDMDTGDLGYLSLTAMLLPTNDGFVGMNSWAIPESPGTYTVYLNAYDAGTEANDEIVNGGGMPGVPGIPVNPGEDGGSGGTGVTMEETNPMVHIHRGNLGDTMADGGPSDLDSRIHRWLNPVAKLIITVE